MKQASAATQATLYGGLLLALWALYFYSFIFRLDPIVEFFFHSFFGIANLGLLFYGQSIVKRLNRNYIPWAVALFFLTPFALIVLGQLSRVEVVIPLNYIVEDQRSNPNRLPTIYLKTGTSSLLDALANDTFTLQHLIRTYQDHLKDYTRMFPVAAAYELNRRNVELAADLKLKLDQFAKENGKPEFLSLVEEIRVMAPWEMIERFN